MHAGPLRQSLAVLFTRRFGTFWFASLLSNIGTWTQQVAQPWLLLSLGASPFLLGVDSFAAGAPVWLLTLVGGLLADRADRRRVILGFQSVQMLCPILLVALILAGSVRPWMVIALSLAIGVTDALSMPSFQSIVPSIVERGQISAGYALNSTQFNLSRIAGPALAGALMATAGAVACFVVSAVSYVPFIAIALWILPARPSAGAHRGDFDPHHPFAALREVMRDRYLRGALATVLATSLLCGPIIVFCPVIVRDAFHGDMGNFSSALASFGTGGLLGAIGLLFVDAAHDRRPFVSGSAFLFGAVLVLIGLDPWLRLLPPLLAVAGVSMIVSNTSANSLLQTFASPQVRGQTAALFSLAMRGGTSLGALVTGFSVSMLGVRHALLGAGALAMLASLAIARGWFRVPARPGNEAATR
jgi:MFS family permease